MQGWKDEYSVGIQIMDDQHKEIFKLVAELKEAFEKKEKIDLEYTLARMDVFALYHFASEEQLMARYAFDGLEEHTKGHQAFRDRLEVFREKYTNFPDKEFEVAEEILSSVQEWIESHLLVLDMEYSRFILAKMDK